MGERGAPPPALGISTGSPHLGFRRLLSTRGKEGLFFTWAWDNRCFVSQGGGVNGGVLKDAGSGIKPAKDLSSQGVGWQQWAALWDRADVEMRMIY